jgi:hypothetical protein
MRSPLLLVKPRYSPRSAPRLLLAANTALNVAFVLLSHRRHLLRESVVPSPSIRLHHQSDCADRLRNPCSANLRMLAVSITTTALLACLSRRRIYTPSHLSHQLRRKRARCPHPATHHQRGVSKDTLEAVGRLQHHLRLWPTISKRACEICEDTRDIS